MAGRSKLSMANNINKKFFLVDRKSVDVVRNERKHDGLWICENGRGFGVTISLGKKDVDWLVDALSDFVGTKGASSGGNTSTT